MLGFPFDGVLVYGVSFAGLLLQTPPGSERTARQIRGNHWQASVKTNAQLVAFSMTTLDNAPPVKRHREANQPGSDKGYPMNQLQVWME